MEQGMQALLPSAVATVCDVHLVARAVLATQDDSR